MQFDGRNLHRYLQEICDQITHTYTHIITERYRVGQADKHSDKHTYGNKSAGNLEQFVTFLMNEQLTVDALETLTTETPDTIRTISTERFLQKHIHTQYNQIDFSVQIQISMARYITRCTVASAVL